MAKVAGKVRKPMSSVNVIVSKKAAKLGISAEAALILLAKEYGIGTSRFQRSLDSSKQAEVQNALPAVIFQGRPSARTNGGRRANKVSRRHVVVSKKAALKAAIEYVIQDPELRSRCADILLAAGHFDRPINQATLVLEDRIRTKAQPPKKMVGEPLVGYAFNEDLTKSVLRVASNDSDDQRGFTQILRGVVPALRNKTHHHLVQTFSREEALRVCGFVDVLLRIVDNSTKKP